ncbi:MAG TPA: hypothetical protein VND92_05575 [Vicinamibacterales bacterium]|nr:hypothetical protein [Vicinamibacterales bacterium]
MTPAAALFYSFLFGLLHGIVPDEHTWPITFSYAIGSGSGRAGMRAGLYFSAAFTLQRMLVSELAYLALAPFLRSPKVNGVVYVIVGAVMSAAGYAVLRRGRYPHLHLLGHHHEDAEPMETTSRVLSRHHGPHEPHAPAAGAPPVRWTLVHGFIAGFGFGGFSLFINTVAAPAMPTAWLGFLPGLLFGLGTTLMLVAVGAAIGTSLRWTGRLSEQEIGRIGAGTGGRTLFYGGWLFMLCGALLLLLGGRQLPVDLGKALIAAFVVLVAIPSLIYSVRDVLAGRARPSVPPA